MSKWKNRKKIDAHVHILPDERRDELISNYGENDPWSVANVDLLIKKMNENNVEKSLLLPINNRYMYYGMREANEFLANTIKKYPNRLIGFADVIIQGADGLYEAPYEVEYAIKELGLSGVKIHPANLNLPADDFQLIPVLRKAAELKVPVMYHSNPWGPGFYDFSSPERINRMIKVFPDINFITAHMGGVKVMDALKAVTYVDLSFSLFDLVDLYGIEGTNRILRKFGPSRLIFGTDYPEENYEKYFNILDQMDFTEEEIDQICYHNILDLLNN